MRSFRVLTLIVVVTLCLAAPNVFAKVCHPKTMITCSAADLSHPAATATVSAPVTKPAPTKAVKSIAPAKNQQAMLCGPWVHWMCVGSPNLS